MLRNVKQQQFECNLFCTCNMQKLKKNLKKERARGFSYFKWSKLTGLANSKFE